jgi:ribonuclease HI
MERLITNRLAYYLESKNLLNPVQSGFRKNRSTIDHLVRLTDHINKTINTGDYTVATFIDFSNAFDMVWKQGLLHKLQKLGIGGNMLNFINDFLTDRSIRVKVGSTLSEEFKLDNGSPQGSVISPILFLIMINDIPRDINQSSGASLFADDSAVWRSGPNLPFLIKKQQNLLDRIQAWCEEWGFKINSSKTVSMIFTKRLKTNCKKLEINGIELEFAEQAKFLGLVFDKKLSWTHHINYVIEKSKSKINLLRTLTGYTWGANKNALLRIYRTLIRSRLEYGSEVFHTANKANFDKLNAKLNMCLRIICGAMSSTSLDALRNECGEPPLELSIYRKQLRYTAKVASSSNHPAKEILIETWHSSRGNFKKQGKPIYDIVTPFLKTVGHIEGVEIPKSPPWLLHQPKVDLELLDIVNKNQNPLIIKQTTLSHFEKYSNCLQIYTDGSKMEDAVGAGFVVPSRDHSHAIRLPSHCTVYAAELTAIKFALEWIALNISNITQQAVILSDSVSALESINNRQSLTRPNLLLDILNTINNIFKQTELTCGTHSVSFAWVPAHVGICSNEKADAVAKAAGRLATVTDRLNTSVGFQLASLVAQDDGHDPEAINSLTANLLHNQPTYFALSKCITDVHKEIDAHIIAKWQQKYDEATDVGQFYKKLEPRVNTQIKFFSKFRRKDKVITRLRLGRPALNYYLHTYGKRASPLCEFCNVNETIDHFIMRCPHYGVLKHIHERTNNTVCTLEDIMTQHDLIDCLFDKLKTIQRII